MKAINKKMTKRDVVRGMFKRAYFGFTPEHMSLSYLGRRIGKSKQEALYFVRALKRMGMIDFIEKSANTIVWSF